MGFKFRKSIKMGPVRVNLSKSGVGVSAGVKGLRVSRSAKGKTRVSAGIPGSGLTYSKTLGKKSAKSSKTSASGRSNVAAQSRHVPAAFEQSAESKKSWPMAIFMAVIGFVVTGFVSFGALFLAIAIFSIFNRAAATGDTARFIIVFLPIVLGAVAAACIVLALKPEKEIDGASGIRVPTEPGSAIPTPSTEKELDATPELESPAEVATEPAEQIDPAVAEFETALQAIHRVDIPLSDPVSRHLLRDLPEYSFSNITRKTRLDSIFPLVFLDVETTGFAPSKCEIVEVAAIKFDSGMTPVAAFTTLCKPKKPIPEEASAVNHITDEMVADAPAFSQIAPALTDFLKGCHMAGHNLDFDLRFIFAHGADLPDGVRFYDTLDLSHLTIPSSSVYNYKLDTVCRYYGIRRSGSHRALSDCYATSKLFSHLVFDKTSRQLDAEAEILSELSAE